MAMNGDETKPPAKILWMKLPGWADDVPENHVLHMTEDTAIRYKIPLTPYNRNNKEKGRKIVLIKKSDIEKVVCTVCGQENDHFSFQCPNDDPDRELMEQRVINGVERVIYCHYCKKKNDHFSWRCPDEEPMPFDPLVAEDLICEYCGVEAEHWTDVCPKRKHTPPPEPEPGSRECLICCKYGDSEHWTEDCPVLANGDCKFCFTCQSLGDHNTDECHKFEETNIFCSCCEATGHLSEDCPREFNDGRKYCGVCNWMCDHLTEHCPLAERRATASGSFTMSKM